MSKDLITKSKLKLQTEERNFGIDVYETPTEVLSRLYEGDSPEDLNDLLNILVTEYNGQICRMFDDFLVVYAVDRGVMPVVNKNGEQVSARDKFDFVKNLQKIRVEIAKKMRAIGVTVLEMEQTAGPLRKSRLGSTGWQRRVDKMEMGMKVNFHYPAEGGVELLKPLEHPYLAREVTLHNYNSIVSFAPYQKSAPTLYDINIRNYPFNKKLKVLKDAMKAGAFLHDQKLVHGDVKSGNIMVALENDPKEQKCVFAGELFDLEGLRNVSDDNREQGTYTMSYSEDFYYSIFSWSGERVLAPNDFKKDIFSWGITLLEICMGEGISKYDGDLDGLIYCCGLTKSLEEQEENLFNFVDLADVSDDFKDLIKSMISYHREERPDLKTVIEIIEDIERKSESKSMPITGKFRQVISDLCGAIKKIK